MKIQDLLEAEFETTKQDYKSNNSYDIDKQKYRYRNRSYDPQSKLKSGAYGKIYRNKDDPHQIAKVPHLPEKTDGYYDFIEHVVNSGIAKYNPHFPRVYDIKKFTDNSGYFKYKIKMETLHPFLNTDPEVIEGMLERYFGQDFVYDYDDAPFDAFLGSLRQGLKKRNFDWIVDEKFREACEFVSDFINSGDYSLDLHSGNVMIRMSPYPQLVFVDPVE